MKNTITLNTDQMAYLVTQIQWQTFFALVEVLKNASSVQECQEMLKDGFNHAAAVNHLLSLRSDRGTLEDIDEAFKHATAEIVEVAEFEAELAAGLA